MNCKIEGCREKYHAKGFCKKHYYKDYDEKNKEKRSDYQKEYWKKNREELIKKDKKYYKKNKKIILLKQKKYDFKNKEYILKKSKEYYQNNRQYFLKQSKIYYETHKKQIHDYDKKYDKKRKKNDVIYKMRHYLSSRFYDAVKLQNTKKLNKTMKLIGCTPNELKQHLENQFKEGMNWNNYGKWHIDHIKPCASFDLSNEEEQFKCFHYNNLQPLWAEENLSKGGKYRQ